MNNNKLSFEELLSNPQVIEYSRIKGKLGILAVHGGKIEPGTEQIASYLAQETGSSLYVISPKGKKDGLYYHVTSSKIDPQKSLTLKNFIDHIEVGISIHGYWENWNTIFLGGRNQRVKKIIARELKGALPDYEIVTNPELMPWYTKGQKRKNIVNQPRAYGVQVELPPSLRQINGIRELEQSVDAAFSDAAFSEKTVLAEETLIVAEAIIKGIKKILYTSEHLPLNIKNQLPELNHLL